MSAALELIGELRAAGIELAVAGDTVRFRPRARMTTELRERLVESKADVISILLRERASNVAAGQSGVAPESQVRAAPRGAAQAGVLFSGDVEPAACCCCGSTGRWRLIGGTHLVCPTCHPPLPGTEEIEFLELGKDHRA